MSLGDADGGTQYFGPNARLVHLPLGGTIRTTASRAVWLLDNVKGSWMEDAPEVPAINTPEYWAALQDNAPAPLEAADPYPEPLTKGRIVGVSLEKDSEPVTFEAAGPGPQPNEPAPHYRVGPSDELIKAQAKELRAERGGIKYPRVQENRDRARDAGVPTYTHNEPYLDPAYLLKSQLRHAQAQLGYHREMLTIHEQAVTMLNDFITETERRIRIAEGD